MERSAAVTEAGDELRRARTALLGTGAAAALLFLTAVHVGGFENHEGRYAEVAREILLTGDWLTTRINGEVYLNKPPLMFWLVAAAFRLGGMGEWARALSGIASLLTVVVVWDLGRRLWRPAAGAWAAVVFTTMLLTPVEARILRPDPLLTLLCAVTLWGAVRATQAPPGSRDRRSGHLALWGSIGIAIMAKGFLGAVLPGLALVPALLLSRLDGADLGRIRRRYFPGWGPLLVLGIILPWHLAVGVVNEGFWWDYVVNQHLLVFFDKKFPRDHIPHPLPLAWGALAARMFPWTLLLPAAVALQLRAARKERSTLAWLPLTWLGVIVVFFSLSSGRLEHYYMPAIPAAALLVGALCARWVEESRVDRPGWRVLPFALVALMGAVGLATIPDLIRGMESLRPAPLLPPLATVAMLLVAVGGTAATALALRRSWRGALLATAAAGYGFAACACVGYVAVEPLLSARPLLASIPAGLLQESEVAYEAGDEYQLCGVLNYYLGRRLVLLEPPGFIPPTFLEKHVDRLFTPRDRFWREWQKGEQRFLLFTDPGKPLDRPDAFPPPVYEVARSLTRRVLTNKPLPLQAR